MKFPGIFICHQDSIDDLNKTTREWEVRASKGECAWICSDCCVTFPDGMPKKCEHGHEGCTKIIESFRDEK